VLRKRNKHKNAYYEAGDKISFRIEGDKSKIAGRILDLKDSVIVFENFEVVVDKITWLYVDNKTGWWLRYKLAEFSFKGGGCALFLYLINSHIRYGGTLIIGGSLIGIGILAKLLIGNKIKIKGRTRLIILNYNK